MALRHSGNRKVLFVTIGILTGFLVIFLVYVLFIRNAEQKGGLFAKGENNTESEIKMVTVPFEAEFAMRGVSTYEDIDLCGNLPWTRIIVEGNGTEPDLGNFNAHMEFCIQASTGVYLDLTGWIVPAEGDSLFVSSWGQVMPPGENDPPYYLNRWDDPFEFTGGTGRFEGATGGGVTHCYVSKEDGMNHHNWAGTLTIREE